MDGPLGADEATWLDEHLAGCAACAASPRSTPPTARRSARLRDAAPEPPRDLWARTASAIEQRIGRRRDPRSGLPAGDAPPGRGPVRDRRDRGRRSASARCRPASSAPSRPTLSEKPSDRARPTGGDAGSGPAVAQATPFAVGAGAVAVGRHVAERIARLQQRRRSTRSVPPRTRRAARRCRTASQQDLPSIAKPSTIIESPAGGQDVVIATAGDDGDQIIVVDLPEGTPTPTTSPTEPTVTPTPSTEPTGTRRTPSGDAVEHVRRRRRRRPRPHRASPSADAGRHERPTPSASPVAAVAAAVTEPLADTVHRGEHRHRQRHRARRRVGGLLGGRLLVRLHRPARRWLARARRLRLAGRRRRRRARSRPMDRPCSPRGTATRSSRAGRRPPTRRRERRPSRSPSASIPTTGVESPAGDVWRPVVDPTRSRAIGWTGSLARSTDGETWVPGSGQLELRDWTPDGARVQGRRARRRPGRRRTPRAPGSTSAGTRPASGSRSGSPTRPIRASAG